jgi:nucleoside-diphosphate-sugar epimerase
MCARHPKDVIIIEMITSSVSDKKKVLLTGASGSMGYAAFRELWKHKNRYDIVLLLLPNRAEKKLFKPFESEMGIRSIRGKGIVENSGLKIAWGDLTDYDDVSNAVEGVDHVLHPAAFVAPKADRNPALARKINTGGTENIIKAIMAQPNGAEHISMVYIGSVACYGDRLPPVALLKSGDPLMPSVFDFYATTKIAAERAVIESGIKHWISLRQTYICTPDALTLWDPIMFHMPVESRIEMNTHTDAGYGLVKTLEQDPDSDFWCRVYNQAGGPACRFIYLDYIEKMVELSGLGDYRKILDRNWFCLRNFHCGWFADAHVLHGYLGHWNQCLEDHFEHIKNALPWYASLAKFVPAAVIKKVFMERLARRPSGPQYWINHPQEMANSIRAFYGSLEKYKQMGEWDWKMPSPDVEMHTLDHGYDESKSVDDLTLEELKKAAAFRGGLCLGGSYSGKSAEKLLWRCAFGHEFRASVALVLLGGHWCPECEAPPWNYDQIAKKNPFLAQAYANTHGRDENNFYSEEDCLKEI